MATKKRLIDANVLEKRIRQEPTDGIYTAEILSAINEQSTVDAVEVVHGRWKQTGMHFLPYECSVCGSEEEGRTNYCPNCGARMDGGVTDAQ